MHSSLRWGLLLVAAIVAGAVLMAPERLPTQAMTTSCTGPAGDGTLLFTSHRPGETGVTLFAADPARRRAPQALVRALSDGTDIAPSPRGRYIALAEGERGLWLVNSDGTGLHRLLPAPPPSAGPIGARLIGAVAWSPDRYTLAYAVVQSIGYPRYATPAQGAPDGLWLVRYDRTSPRLLVTNARLGIDGIGHLSFSADGRTLVAAADRGRSSDDLMIDRATGRATALFALDDNVADVHLSPVAARLVYLATVFVPVAGQPNTSEADDGVYIADLHGHHRTMLTRTTSSTFIQDPIWSPDGRSVAYLWGGPPHPVLNEVHAVDVATGRVRTLVGMAPRQQFMSLAWMHCRA